MRLPPSRPCLIFSETLNVTRHWILRWAHSLRKSVQTSVLPVLCLWSARWKTACPLAPLLPVNCGYLSSTASVWYQPAG